MKRYPEEIPSFCFGLASHFIAQPGIWRHVMSRGIRTVSQGSVNVLVCIPRLAAEYQYWS
uniref:WGS project CBMI000000000 data, contig CS3069_c003127 n=1 Tax=Fusarium clavum TaxID=2594811 RepID=A0A090MDD4_9HYPO|nr:unnamed protein product [Fusarium clavum]